MTPETRREYDRRFAAMSSFGDVIRLRLWLRRECGMHDAEAQELRGVLATMAQAILPDTEPAEPRIGRD